ncbi:hypothetical protein JOF53_006028 [Crossiella equi]|uniref:DUF8017 domain-containing protein n=1 Tax=Crossiella equi TaxID=130796 RepID=A0ABS5AL61_9PSEU|nr:hypothetical protein [Crossiella equi]MBP2477156.1 hypothetical protein [Crossiella equi]
MTSSGQGQGQDPPYWERYQHTEFHGATPDYGGLGVYGASGPPPGPPPSRRGRQLLVVGLSAVIVVGLVAIVFLANGSDEAGSQGTSAVATATSTASTTSQRPTTAPAASTGPSTGTVAPQVAGWQGVWTKRGLAYDVPPAWKVLGASTIIGFEDANGPKVGMSGASTFREGFCTADPKRKSAKRAIAGVGGAKISDPAVTAAEAAKLWADGRYGDTEGEQPRIDVGKVQALTVGSRAAARVTATVTVPGTRHQCDPPAGVVHVVAVAGQGTEQGAVFVVQADQDAPDSAAAAELSKIVSSLRVIP